MKVIFILMHVHLRYGDKDVIVNVTSDKSEAEAWEQKPDVINEWEHYKHIAQTFILVD